MTDHTSQAEATIPGFEGHSPLLWTHMSGNDDLVAKILDANGEVVALLGGIHGDFVNAERDMPLIVAAMNAYPLLDEMGKALGLAGCLYSPPFGGRCGVMRPTRLCAVCAALDRYHELGGQHVS